ncbi:MAG TPA: carboxypeptidase-like regulatory domain-containing protein, partial [Terriglobales bacterium]|nr:carboxypeptidase-like regulatory domain-containing protein [Terriglobales bacterium]
MTKLMRMICVAVLFALGLTGAWAQSIATAQLGGTVKDPKGAVVPNVTITVRDAAKNFERTTLTAPDGEYQILQLPPGTYTVTASSPGFAKFTAKAVALTVGQTAILPINLSISTTEVVEVNAQAQIV